MFFVGSDTLFVGLDRSQACFLRLKVYPEGHFTHLLRYFVSSLGLFFLSLRHFVSSLRLLTSSLGLFFLLLRHFVSSLRLLTSTEGHFASMEEHLTSSLGLFFLLLRHFVSLLRLLTSTERYFASSEGHLTSSLGYFVPTEGHRLHSDILREAKKAFVEGSERCFQYLFLWEILLNRSAKALPNTVPATAPVRMSSGK